MPELTGKLDTSVNGPEGLSWFGGGAWERVDWRFHEEQVGRLRGRIFKAVRAGDWPLARNVQKLALRSLAGGGPGRAGLPRAGGAVPAG